MNNSGHAKRLPLPVHITIACAIGVVLALTTAAGFVAKQNVLQGVATAPAEVMEVTIGQRKAYAARSDKAHEAWKAADSTQRSIALDAFSPIEVMNAGKLRDSEERIPHYCMLEEGGKLLKLAPTHDGYIAVQYIAPTITPNVDPEACQGDEVTLMKSEAIDLYVVPVFRR